MGLAIGKFTERVKKHFELNSVHSYFYDQPKNET